MKQYVTRSKSPASNTSHIEGPQTKTKTKISYHLFPTPNNVLKSISSEIHITSSPHTKLPNTPNLEPQAQSPVSHSMLGIKIRRESFSPANYDHEQPYTHRTKKAHSTFGDKSNGEREREAGIVHREKTGNEIQILRKDECAMHETMCALSERARESKRREEMRPRELSLR